MTELRKRRLRNKIQSARSRLMVNCPFFALLLMYLRFVAVPGMKKISTNGRCIFFDPGFVDKLYEGELDYILCHQIMHIIYGHIWRPFDLAGDNYHFACDIQINCQLEALGFDQDYFPHMGYVYRTIPASNKDPLGLSIEAIYDEVPFNLYALEDRERNRFLPDNDSWWDKKDGNGRDGIIILDLPEMESVIRDRDGRAGDGGQGDNGDKGNGSASGNAKGDRNHSDGIDGDGNDEGESGSKQGWKARAAAAAKSLSAGSGGLGFGIGNVPAFIQRIAENTKKPSVDWRKLLNNFLQERICDYSFSPPDRRFEDTGFFLPDFNEKEFVCRDILFMVDTSGSVNNDDLGAVYSEIRGAVEQFNGKLTGKLGFFDAEVIPPVPFEGVDDLMRILPYGGGGTDFFAIFDYVRDNYKEELPACIVIFTDGFAQFPAEKDAMGIPVLWLINNEEITPPWGKTTRILTRKAV